MIFDPMANAVKEYVDAKAKTATDTANTKVSKSGDTMTGDLFIKKVRPAIALMDTLEGGDTTGSGISFMIKTSDTSFALNGGIDVTKEKSGDETNHVLNMALNNGSSLENIFRCSVAEGSSEFKTEIQSINISGKTGDALSSYSNQVLTVVMAKQLATLVHTTGNEEISGNKTFKSNVTVSGVTALGTATASNPTSDSNNTTIATTSWVNSRISGGVGAIPLFSAAVDGLVPKATSETQFLRGDGEWATPANTEYGVATTTVNGLMSSGDKKKLDGIASGAQVNVLETIKVNGTALTLSSKAVDITVGNATLTIQKNGVSAGTFTANSSENKTINITVPTKTSELKNDSGFRTSDSDDSVMQSEPSDSDWSNIAPNNTVPILLRGVDTSGATGGVYYDSGIYVNPKQNAILANSFSGDLYGNATSATKATTADSATKATQDGNGNNIANTYATKAVATQTANGLMSKADKEKLDSYSNRMVIRTGQPDKDADTWHICASVSGTPCAYQDIWAMFHIECGMETYVKSGFLYVWMRFDENANLINTSAQKPWLRWVGMPIKIYPDDFLLNVVQDSTTKTVNARIFIKAGPYEIYTVSLINRGYRYQSGSLFNWDLVGDISAGGQNATGQGTKIYSEFEDTTSHMRIGPTDVFGSYGYTDTPSDNYWPPVELFLRDKNTQNLARIQPIIMNDKNAAVLFVRQKDGNETAYRFESTTGQIVVSKPNIGDYTITGANMTENDFGGQVTTTNKTLVFKQSNNIMFIYGKVKFSGSSSSTSTQTITFPQAFSSNSLPWVQIMVGEDGVYRNTTQDTITNTSFRVQGELGTKPLFYMAVGFY